LDAANEPLLKCRVTNVDSKVKAAAVGSVGNDTHVVRLDVLYGWNELVTCEDAILVYHKNVEVQKKVKIPDNETDSATVNSTDANATVTPTAEAEASGSSETANEPISDEKTNDDAADDEQAASEEPKVEGAEVNATTNVTVEKKKPKYKTITVVEPKNVKETLHVDTKTVAPHPVSDSEITSIKAAIKEGEKVARHRRELAAAKNDLESWIYWAKEDGILGETALLAQYVTTEEREKLVAALATVDTWLEEEANDSTTKEDYNAKLTSLKEAASSITAKKDADDKKAKEEAAAKAKAKKAAKKKAEKAEESKKEESQEQSKDEAKDDAKDDKDGSKGDQKEEDAKQADDEKTQEDKEDL